MPEFGRIAAGLSEGQPETEFQAGLRRFSYLLLRVAIALTVMILVTNLMLHRPLINSALFALAIAVSITPQLLPAVVSTSLATGSRQLAKAKVLVDKRPGCIEDLGDIHILITYKPAKRRPRAASASPIPLPAAAHTDSVLRLALLASDVDPGDRHSRDQRAGQCTRGTPTCTWSSPWMTLCGWPTYLLTTPGARTRRIRR